MNIAPSGRRTRDILGLIGFLALSAAVSALGGLATASSVGTWYVGLAKPPFNPPNWVFAPIWTTLYVLIAIAGWRVWRRYGLKAPGSAMMLFGVQMALNLAWSVVFFGLQQVGAALVVVLVLLGAIVATGRAFWRLDKPAGAIFAPYAAWVGFATALNLTIWRLNGG